MEVARGVNLNPGSPPASGARGLLSQDVPLSTQDSQRLAGTALALKAGVPRPRSSQPTHLAPSLPTPFRRGCQEGLSLSPNSFNQKPFQLNCSRFRLGLYLHRGGCGLPLFHLRDDYSRLHLRLGMFWAQPSNHTPELFCALSGWF